MQAAVGVSQLKKLPRFIEARKANWKKIYEGLSPFEKFFIMPEHDAKSDPSWFGFVLTVREDAPFSRNDLVRCLESHRIGTRLRFGGNLTRQPAYQQEDYRIVGNLTNTDKVMANTFWIGVYPGITDGMIEYTIDVFRQFLGRL